MSQQNYTSQQINNILISSQLPHQPLTNIKLIHPTNSIKHIIGQLQNKSKFFQGQIDPLNNENMALKQQVIQAQRILKNATEMLRNLLPMPLLPQKRLELQLANIDGVSQYIRQDWMHMKEQISNFQGRIQQKMNFIAQLQQTIKQNIAKHQKDMADLKEHHKQLIKQLRQQHNNQIDRLQLKIIQLNTKITQLSQSHDNIRNQYTNLKAEYNRQITQYKHKLQQNNKKIQQQSEQISLICQQNQANRKLLTQHYMNMVAQRQKQLKQSYEQVLMIKQQQYANNMKQMINVQNTLSMKVLSKQQQILQLYQLNHRYITQKQEIAQQKRILQQNLIAQKQKTIKLTKQIQQHQSLTQQLHNNYQQKLKTKQNQVHNMKQQLTKLIQTIANLQQQKQKQIKRHEQQVKNKDKIIRNQQVQHRKIRQQMMSKQYYVSTLLAQIEENKKQIQYYQKYQILNKQLHNKIQAYQLSEQQTNLQIQQYIKALANKQQQIKTIHNTHNNRIQTLQQQHTKRIQQIKKQHINKQLQLQQNNKEFINRINQQHSQRYQQLQYLHNKLQQQYQYQTNHLKQNINNLTNAKNGLQKQLVVNQQQKEIKIKTLLAQHKDQMAGLQKQCLGILQDKTNKYSQQLQQINQTLKSKQKKFKQRLQGQQKQFRNKLQAKDKQFNSELQMLRKDIQTLKASNGIAEIQSKYTAMIYKIKEQAANEKQKKRLHHNKQLDQLKQNWSKKFKNVQQQNIKKLKQLQQQNVKNLQLLTNIHAKQIKQIKHSHIQQMKQKEYKFNGQLQKVSQKLLTNIEVLNQQLLQQKQTHKFSKLSIQQKFTDLTNKITNLNKICDDKNTKIRELQKSIKLKNKQLQDIDKLVTQKLRKKKQQYDLYVQNIEEQCKKSLTNTINQCNQKIKITEQQRIKFTENMYKDFKEIKQKYQTRLNSLQRQYDELQTLFQERPSRIEDVKKIKQLSLIKQKMDLQAKQMKNKIVSANQIVKYLNLQLQNYKEVYDIFGPQLLSAAQDPDKKQQQLIGYVRGTLQSLIRQFDRKPNRNKEEPQKNRILNVRKILKQRHRRANTQMSATGPFKDKQPASNDFSLELVQKVGQESQQQITIQKKKIFEPSLTKLVTRSYRQKKLSKVYQNNQKTTLQKQPKKQKLDNAGNQLRCNAQIFLSLMEKTRQPVAEIRKSNQSYRKMSDRKKSSTKTERYLTKQGKYKIKDNLNSIQH